MRQLEAQLRMLLVACHDDAGFWPAFAKLMHGLDDGLTVAECVCLRSHADFLLVRAGMSSWTLSVAASSTTAVPVR